MCEQRIFKMHIAQDLNDLLKQIDWTDRVCRGIIVTTNDVTDDMVAQIQQAMCYDKKSTKRKHCTHELYYELLYNDILPNKETI